MMNKWQQSIVDRLRYAAHNNQTVTLGADEVHIPLNAMEENERQQDEIAALRDENAAFKADIEAWRLVRLPCGVGDTVYELWYSPCHHGETHPDSSGCCGCEDECDMKRVVNPVRFMTLAQILSKWSSFESGWYYMTEQAARAALDAREGEKQ